MPLGTLVRPSKVHYHVQAKVFVLILIIHTAHYGRVLVQFTSIYPAQEVILAVVPSSQPLPGSTNPFDGIKAAHWCCAMQQEGDGLSANSIMQMYQVR